MNIGVVEASKNEEMDWNCFIFHDVDMLPENESNIYSCYDKMPKQMADTVSTYNYRYTINTINSYQVIVLTNGLVCFHRTKGYFEDEYFGGVNAFTKKQMLEINGFSNLYFLWGGEDDDARIR